MARLRLVSGEDAPDGFGALHEWRAWAGQDLAPHTVQEYGKVLNRFFPESGIPYQEVRLPDLVRWMSRASVRRPGEPLAPPMATLARQAFLHFYTYCRLAGYVEHNPAAGLPVRRGRLQVPVHLTWEQLTRLVYAAAMLKEKWAWTILFLYVTGARVAEAAGVQPERDITFSPGHMTVTLRETKRRPGEEPREREIPLSFPRTAGGDVAHEGYDLGERVVAECMRFYPSHRADAHSRITLFGVGTEALWERVHKAGTLAGLPPRRRNPHVLRGTFCTHLLEAGVDAYVVKTLMGHAKLETTMRYAEVTDPRRRQAIAKLGRWQLVE